MSERPEWVHCVGFGDAVNDGKTWCGRNERPFFIDPTHAALNGYNGGRLVACRECAAEIRKSIENGHDDQGYGS